MSLQWNGGASCHRYSDTLCGDNTTILLQRNRHLLSRVDTHLLGLALLQAEYSSIYAPLLMHQRSDASYRFYKYFLHV